MSDKEIKHTSSVKEDQNIVEFPLTQGNLDSSAFALTSIDLSDNLEEEIKSDKTEKVLIKIIVAELVLLVLGLIPWIYILF